MREKPRTKRHKPFAEKVNEQVEKIVYQVMTNDGLEQTISKAVQKSLIALVLRYWLLAVVGILALSVVQAIFFTLALKWLWPTLK